MVRHLSPRGSNFRCEGDLNTYLKEHDITGIQGVDTRALTKILRSQGSRNGMLTCAEHFNVAEVMERLRSYEVKDTVRKVTRTQPEVFEAYGRGEVSGRRDGLRREAEHHRVPAPPRL